MSPSKFLPSVFTIRGLRAAQGLVFLDDTSARDWLRFNEIHMGEHIRILPAEVIYYGGGLGSKTTEDLIRERNSIL